MSQQTLLPGAILLILAADSWWLAEKDADESTMQEPAAHTPDYLLESFKTLKDVDINSRKDRVQFKGMQVWFNKPTHIKLLAMVRGRYEVN